MKNNNRGGDGGLIERGALINFLPPEKGEGGLLQGGGLFEKGGLEDLQYSHKKKMWSKQSSKFQGIFKT